MAGLLENINKFKHVYKTLDAMRETSGILHSAALEMGESIDCAITVDKVSEDIIGILNEKTQQQKQLSVMDVSKAIEELKNSAVKLQCILDKYPAPQK